MFYDYPKLFDYDCEKRDRGDGAPVSFVGNYVEQANPKSMYEMLKDDPKFKAFCARRINGKVVKPKRFKVPIPKPIGTNSVLGPYTTGRIVKTEFHSVPYPPEPDYPQYLKDEGREWPETETLIMQKINGEFVSTPRLFGDSVPQGVANFWIDLRIEGLELEQKRLKKKLERRAA